MPTQKELIAELQAQVKTLTETVKGIEERFAPKDVEEKPTEKVEEVAVVDESEKYPAYRVLVNEVLNKHFTFRVEGGPNPAFLNFVVSVPKKYSNASDAHWQMFKEDVRPKAIAINEGEPAMRAHLEKVFSNFNPDLKALIVNDR